MSDNTSELLSSNGGLTCGLCISILHGLVGGICFGYNAVLFNVPEDYIRNNAAEKYIDDNLWGLINAMFVSIYIYFILIHPV